MMKKLFATLPLLATFCVLSCLGSFQMASAQSGTSSPYEATRQRSVPGVTKFQENGFRAATKSTQPSTSGQTLNQPLKPSFSSNPPPRTQPPRGFQGTAQTTQTSQQESSRYDGSSIGMASTQVTDSEIKMPVCTVEFIDDVELPALEAGPLTNLFVKEGDSVPNGKIVATIDDRILQGALVEAVIGEQLAGERAADVISIDAAVMEYNLNKLKYDKAYSLGTKGSVPQNEVKEAEFQKEIAKLKYKAAKRDKRQAVGEVQVEGARADQVRQRIARHELKVDFDGYVIELKKQKGEWCQAGEPVMQVARLNELYVSGNLPSNSADPHEVIGQKVTVTAKTASGNEVFEGEITNVGLVNLESGEHYKVKATVKNKLENGQWLLRKGSKVSMKIQRNSRSSTASGMSELPPRR